MQTKFSRIHCSTKTHTTKTITLPTPCLTVALMSVWLPCCNFVIVYNKRSYFLFHDLSHSFVHTGLFMFVFGFHPWSLSRVHTSPSLLLVSSKSRVLLVLCQMTWMTIFILFVTVHLHQVTICLTLFIQFFNVCPLVSPSFETFITGFPDTNEQ